MTLKLKAVLVAAIAGFIVVNIPREVTANTGKIIATYYRNGQLIIDDHHAEFEVVSNSAGNPSLGDTIRVIRWSDGTITNISRIGDENYMGGYPANSYGVGYLGGRIYEAYCTENSVAEMVCYKFR